MEIDEKIRILLIRRGIKSEAEFARRLKAAGLEKMSPQNLSNKLNRKTFSREELNKIAEVLDCTYEFREWFKMNDTGEEI